MTTIEASTPPAALPVDDAYAHLWWSVFVAIIALVAPFVTVLVLTARPGIKYVNLLYTATAFAFAPAWFLVLLQWPKLRKAAGIPQKYSERVRALGVALIRPTVLGWAILAAGVLVAVTGGFISFGAQNLTAPARPWLSVGPPVVFDILDRAAHDMTRAATVGLIVIFFMQMIRVHLDAVKLTEVTAMSVEAIATTVEKSAATALEASAQIVSTRSDLEHLRSEIRTATDDAINMFVGGHEIVKADAIISGIGRLLQASKASGGLKYATVATQFFRKNLDRMLDEIAFEAAADDSVGLTVFRTVLATYFESESLNFFGLTPGNGGLELPTRFVQYAYAVRLIVAALESDAPGRYSFFTVFSKEPRAFLNIANGGADFRWSLLYLERFCRSHAISDVSVVDYRRFFVCTREQAETVPYFDSVTSQLEHARVLCSADGQPLLNVREADLALLNELTDERDEAEVAPLLKLVWPDASRQHIAEIVRANASHLSGKPGYVILDKPPAGQHGLTWCVLKNVLRRYHSIRFPPKLVIFDDALAYDAVFADGLPRDFLAVRDETGGWVFCLGTDGSGRDADMPIRLRLLTKRRSKAYGAEWNRVVGHLDQLFGETHDPNGSPLFEMKPLLD
jgi:hypothetical protein